MYNIALVEDEKDLNDILSLYLKKEGYNVSTLFTAREALSQIAIQNIHLWIVDIMLPDGDGFEILKEIKKHNEDLPVIFISARSEDMDRIVGLEMGSDDYMPKPFLPRELIIRTNKLLERFYGKNTSKLNTKNILFQGYKLDKDKRKLTYKDEIIELTSMEFDILLYFIENKGMALSREQLISKVWGRDYCGSDRAVDNLIKRLRKKVRQIDIETIYGYGYRCNI